jgi:hypothetical protein
MAARLPPSKPRSLFEGAVLRNRAVCHFASFRPHSSHSPASSWDAGHARGSYPTLAASRRFLFTQIRQSKATELSFQHTNDHRH